MTNITPFTKIFVLISVSIFFGNSCKWNLEFIPEPFICGDIVLDSRDSMDYRTKTFGTQCWMLDNMKIGTKLTVGESIKNGEFEYYCSNQTLCTAGGLYKWEELFELNGICPDGWHIPNKDEYQILCNFLAGDNCDDNLTEPLTTQFKDKFMFNLRGFLDNKNMLLNQGSTGGLWTAIEDDDANHVYILWMTTITTNNILRITMKSTKEFMADERYSKKSGFYVRCVKDD